MNTPILNTPIVKLPASQLIWDRALLSSRSFDSNHATRIADSLKAGAVLPPLLIEEKTNRIIGGVHRWHAYQAVYGPEIEIPCQLVNLNEEDIFLLAVADNAAHGRRLSAFEETEVIIEAQRKGISMSLLSDVMKMPLDRITKLYDGKTGFVRAGQSSATPGQPIRVPLKSGLKSALRGKELTPSMELLNERIGGMQLVYYIRLVQMMLDADILNLKPELANDFREIQRLLKQKLPPQPDQV